MKIVLTIGGTDVGGGSGIQADIKTILVNGCYGTSVVTALAAHGKQGTGKLMNIPPEYVEEQLDMCIREAVPDAVKIGMLPNAEAVRIVADKIREHNLINIVLNPILLSADNEELVPRDVFEAVKEEILPQTDFITPDISELEYFSSKKITVKEDIIDASKVLSEKYGCTIATKGGRLVGDAADLFFRDGYYKWFPGMIIPNANLHDAGNAIACAVAANLAKGYDPDKAFKCAKDIVTEMLLNMIPVGQNTNALNHSALVKGTFMGMLSDQELSRM